MLTALSIQNIILIERLTLAFEPGLTVLTGETGAGKSILLDALGLALGGRSDAGLVRPGATQAIVTAEFEVPPDHPALQLIAEQGLEVDGNLILRRQVSGDGRSRAFINDQPVGVTLLRQLGDTLVEIEGQFEAQGLLDPGTHREHLDRFAELETKRAKCSSAHRQWRDAEAAEAEARAALVRAQADEEFLRHAVGELDLAEPQPGEETELATERSKLSHREQSLEALSSAEAELVGDRGSERTLLVAMRRLQRLGDKLGPEGEQVLAALDRAAIELRDGVDGLQRLIQALDSDPKRLEKIEERLFLLRDLARKHRVAVEALPGLHQELKSRLSNLEGGSQSLQKLAAETSAKRQAYVSAAEDLSKARHKAAKTLKTAINKELPPLKLERARVALRIERMPEGQWGEAGWDQVAIEVATNPGAEPGPINRVASGGELARLMLALKVVLSAGQPVPTLIFDEVDAGIGGATAAAVGDRLKRLSRNVQLLVITHSPQVAALGDQHWRVEKSVTKGGASTNVAMLDEKLRREEIARMLSGASVTDEARAAADKLLVAK